MPLGPSAHRLTKFRIFACEELLIESSDFSKGRGLAEDETAGCPAQARNQEIGRCYEEAPEHGSAIVSEEFRRRRCESGRDVSRVLEWSQP